MFYSKKKFKKNLSTQFLHICHGHVMHTGISVWFQNFWNFHIKKGAWRARQKPLGRPANTAICMTNYASILVQSISYKSLNLLFKWLLAGRPKGFWRARATSGPFLDNNSKMSGCIQRTFLTVSLKTLLLFAIPSKFLEE